MQARGDRHGENKDYAQVMGHGKAPFLKGTLAKGAAVFTQMYGEEHPSQGNVFWFCIDDNLEPEQTDYETKEHYRTSDYCGGCHSN